MPGNTRGDPAEVITTITLRTSEHARPKQEDVSKGSLRRLRVDWMYTNRTFQWLNDQVFQAYNMRSGMKESDLTVYTAIIM